MRERPVGGAQAVANGAEPRHSIQAATARKTFNKGGKVII